MTGEGKRRKRRNVRANRILSQRGILKKAYGVCEESASFAVFHFAESPISIAWNLRRLRSPRTIFGHLTSGVAEGGRQIGTAEPAFRRLIFYELRARRALLKSHPLRIGGTDCDQDETDERAQEQREK